MQNRCTVVVGASGWPVFGKSLTIFKVVFFSSKSYHVFALFVCDVVNTYQC